MISIFIDSSVLFTACQSKTGASALILDLCRKKKLKGYISKYVIFETKKNISLKLDQKAKQRFNNYILQAKLIIVEDPTNEEVKSAKKIISEKDAVILSGAKKSRVDFLLTFNSRDFFKTQVQKFLKPGRTISPKDFIENFI
jgi:predicted nucleic acid-binding protein